MENMKMVSSPQWNFVDSVLIVVTYAMNITDMNIPAVRMGSGASITRDDGYSGALGLAILRMV